MSCPAWLDGLHLEPGRGQPRGDLGGLDGHLHRRVLAQPGKRKLHGQISIPKARLNRTSPSVVSRMSVTPLPIMSVRSMPSPNANPR